MAHALLYVVVVGLLIYSVEQFKRSMTELVERCRKPRAKPRTAFSSEPLHEYFALPEIPGDTASQRFNDFVPPPLRVMFSTFAVVKMKEHDRENESMKPKNARARGVDEREISQAKISVHLQEHAQVLYGSHAQPPSAAIVQTALAALEKRRAAAMLGVHALVCCVSPVSSTMTPFALGP